MLLVVFLGKGSEVRYNLCHPFVDVTPQRVKTVTVLAVCPKEAGALLGLRQLSLPCHVSPPLRAFFSGSLPGLLSQVPTPVPSVSSQPSPSAWGPAESHFLFLCQTESGGVPSPEIIFHRWLHLLSGSFPRYGVFLHSTGPSLWRLWSLAHLVWCPTEVFAEEQSDGPAMTISGQAWDW